MAFQKSDLVWEKCVTAAKAEGFEGDCLHEPGGGGHIEPQYIKGERDNEISANTSGRENRKN